VRIGCPDIHPDLHDLKNDIFFTGYRGMMEEKEGPLQETKPEEEKRREVDLNALFPGKNYDLNRLFPDDETKKLLHELRRNRRDIDRFIKSLNLEEE
jgi:hypothetical protein